MRLRRQVSRIASGGKVISEKRIPECSMPILTSSISRLAALVVPLNGGLVVDA
jgi:hypothetical protein